MIASHLTGWSSNQAMQLSRIDTDGKGPCGDWKLGPPPVFGPGEDISYDSQVTYIFPLADPKGAGPPLWVYLADRWNYEGPLPGSVANATYVWLPILPLKGTENPTQYAVPSVDNWSPSQFFNKTLALTAANLPPARRYSVLPLRGGWWMSWSISSGGGGGRSCFRWNRGRLGDGGCRAVVYSAFRSGRGRAVLEAEDRDRCRGRRREGGDGQGDRARGSPVESPPPPRGGRRRRLLLRARGGAAVDETDGQ